MKRGEVSWVKEGEKYALIAVNAQLDAGVRQKFFEPDLWTVPHTQFQMPSHWSEWLGKVRVEEIESANLFLLSKLKSKAPEVLDEENKSLQRLVLQFYRGLMLASPFSTAHKPIIFTGAHRNGEVDIRQQGSFESLKGSILKQENPLTSADIGTGAQIASSIRILEETVPNKDRWRLNRVFYLYLEARTMRDILSRIHQFARCVEGLIAPTISKTTKQFKSRTELFIGPGHHGLMEDIYSTRSAVEHLHEYRYLMDYDREVQLSLLKKEAIIEEIARTAICAIVSRPELWKHFLGVDSINTFWSLSDKTRREIWGQPIDPFKPLEGFRPEIIDDKILEGTH